MTTLLLSPYDRISHGNTVSSLIKTEETTDGQGRFLHGAFQIKDFLTDDGRHYLEGQIFAYGPDLRLACRTVQSSSCPDEIVVPNADQQLPVVGEFASEFASFIQDVVPMACTRCIYQLRVYEPSYKGHPPHVDYAPGFVLKKRSDVRMGLTSVSYSLPISWNDGLAPQFDVESSDQTIRQTEPGSLVIFGPRIVHAHPAAPKLSSPYAWLIVQSFHEFRA